MVLVQGNWVKEKVVIKVNLTGRKSRTKAMKIVVGLSGVESAIFKGDDKSQIVVTGDNIDADELLTTLRTKVGYAEIVNVELCEPIVNVNGVKKDEKTEEMESATLKGDDNIQIEATGDKDNTDKMDAVELTTSLRKKHHGRQMVVINVSMNSQKSRVKALKIAVSFSGVYSASLTGDDKNQIEVTGENIDAVELVTALRKKVGYAEIVTVKEAEEDEKKDEPYIQPIIWPYSAGLPQYQFYEVRDTYDNPSCSLM